MWTIAKHAGPSGISGTLLDLPEFLEFLVLPEFDELLDFLERLELLEYLKLPYLVELLDFVDVRELFELS